MEGPEILYCLKKGDFEYVFSDIKEYLLVPLNNKKNLSKSELKMYSDFAYRFLHIYVYKLDEIPDLEETLHMLRDCYIVAQMSRKKTTDVLLVENVLFHLIMKVIKKQHLSWANIFCDHLTEDLTSALSNEDATDQVAHFSYVLYVALWNAVIVMEKQKSVVSCEDVVLSLNCRHTALKLLGLTNKEVAVLVNQTCATVSKARSMVKSEPMVKDKAFHCIEAIITNAMKVLCTKSNTATDLDEISKGFSELMITQIKFLLHFRGFSEATSVCVRLFNFCNQMESCDHFTEMFAGLDKILRIAIQASKLNVELFEMKKLAGLSDLNQSFQEYYNITETWRKAANSLEYSYPVLRVAIFAMDVLLELVQNLSHSKISTDESKSILKCMLQFSESLRHKCENMLTVTTLKSATRTCLCQDLIKTYISWLSINYYYVTLFIQDNCLSGLQQRVAQIEPLILQTLATLDKEGDYCLDFHSSLADVTFKLGREYYFNRKFQQAIPYFVMACRQVRDVTSCSQNLPPAIQNGRHYMFLADAYRHTDQHQLALQCVVQGIRLSADNLSDLVTFWVKVKVDIQTGKKDVELLRRTLSGCYHDDKFVTFLPPLSPSGDSSNTATEGGSTILSARTLLEAELKALKEHSYTVCEAELAVIEQLGQITEDPVDSVWLELNKARLLWLKQHDKQSLYDICADAVTKLESMHGQQTHHAHVEDYLATALLWTYILRDVDPIQVLKIMQEEKAKKQSTGGSSSASSSRPSSPVEDKISEDEGFDDYVTVAMEGKLLQPIDRALELWEQLAASSHVTDKLYNVKETAESLLLIAGIYKLAKKHTHQWRALLSCLTLASNTTCHSLCLQVRSEMVMLLNELRQPYLAVDVTTDTDLWLRGLNKEKLQQSVYYAEYLLAKANMLLLLGKQTESNEVIQQVVDLKSKYLKSHIKENLIIDVGLNVFYARLVTSSLLSSERPVMLSAPADTKLELLHYAVYFISKVVCSVMGDWMIYHSTATTDGQQAPNNTLEKWTLLDLLLSTLYEAGLNAIEAGEAREAMCVLAVGIRLSKAFMLPRRLAEFHIGIGYLDTLCGKYSDCKAHLHVVTHILNSKESSRRQNEVINEDSQTDYQLKLQPIDDDNNSDRIISDSENFDRSGCASPETKKKQVKAPDNWQDDVTCSCLKCEDLTSTKLNICRLSIEAQMNIFEQDFMDAQSLLQLIVTNFAHLTNKARHTLRSLGLDIPKVVALKNKKKSAEALKLHENKSKQKICISVYQDQIVDVCLQICHVAVECSNNVLFNKWSQKLIEMGDRVKYPWMFTKNSVCAEHHYLNIARHVSIADRKPPEHDMDKLCMLMSCTKISNNNAPQCLSPDASMSIAPIKKQNKPTTTRRIRDKQWSSLLSRDTKSEHKARTEDDANIKPDSDKVEKRVTFTDSPDAVPFEDSPSSDIKQDIINLAMAPVKAKRGMLATRMMLHNKKTSKSHAAQVMIGSPSVLAQMKTPMAKQKRSVSSKAHPAGTVRIYEETDSDDVTGSKQCPGNHAGTNAVNMLMTPVSVCSSRRAVLDMLINSDDSPDCVVHEASGKAAKTRARQTEKASKCKTTRTLAKKSCSIKVTPSLEKSNTTVHRTLMPHNSLPTKSKKQAAELNKCSISSGQTDIYQFPDFDEGDERMNKSKPKGKKSSKAGKKVDSLKSKDCPQDVKATDENSARELGEDCTVKSEIISHQQETAKCKRIGRVRQRKEVKELAPRLTRARTKITEQQRAEITNSDVEELQLSFGSGNLELSADCSKSLIDALLDPPLDVGREVGAFTSLSHHQSPSCLIEDYPNGYQNEIQFPDLDLSIELFRGDVDDQVAADNQSGINKQQVRRQLSPTEDSEQLRKSQIHRAHRNDDIGEVKVKDKLSEGKNGKNRVKITTAKSTENSLQPAMTTSSSLSSLQGLFNSLRHNPPTLLYRKLCHTIALLLLDSGAPMWQIAYYLTEGQAVTFRHKAQLAWWSKLRKLEKVNTSNDRASRLSYMREQLRFDKTQQSLQSMISELPEAWTICQVSVVSNPGTQKRHLVITRLTRDKDPLVISLPGYSDSIQLLSEYSLLMQQSSACIRVKDRAQWWKDRYKIDEEIKTILGKFEHNWLGCWRGILHGKVLSADGQQKLTDGVNKLITDWDRSTLVSDAQDKLELLFSAECHLTEQQLLEGIISLCDGGELPAVEICQRVKQFQEVSKSVNIDLCQRGPVILVLDKDLQHLPWENFPSLETQQMTRLPSVYFIYALYHCLSSNEKSVWNEGIHTDRTFYIIDPDSNLPATTDMFADWFQKIKGWRGLTNKCPTSNEFREGLTDNDIFVYLGHGSGTKFLCQESLEASECHAAVHILGCSSGKLTSAGQLEASGTMLHYCIAGGPYTMGCLWDVTDRDIDRFTESLLKSLLTTRCQQLLETINAGRSACRMRYLTGAAPIVYGLPIKIASSQS